MKTTISAYDVCQRYIKDYHHVFESSIFNKLLGYCRARDFARLVTCTQLESSCTLYSARTHRCLMQIEAFFKKNASLDVGINTKEVALSSFKESEQLCAETNNFLDKQCAGPHPEMDVVRQQQVERAQAYIRRVLGPFNDFLDGLPSLIRVTSGASATSPRRRSLPYLKVHKKMNATASCIPYLQSLSDYFGYGKVKIYHTEWNRVVTVPKNWKTDRTIACEPTGNLPLQLAFDKFAKIRLRKNKINLSDQSLNQRLAYEGSVSGELATIDLSQASDTIAYNTVALLLPWEWFRYLADVRSPAYKDSDGKIHLYHKFSSMGNGATFALETLIFASACYAVGSNSFSVYGDDIIIESNLYDKVIDMLEFLGFKVNDEKSYATGPFRESCGKHFYEGHDVTPFYLRSSGTSKSELCHIVNGLMCLGYEGSELWKYLASIVTDARLPLVPFNESSMSGVWIDISSAYKLKLMQTKGWVVRFKGYSGKTESIRIYDSRTLFLWYLSREGNNWRPPLSLRQFAMTWRRPFKRSVVPLPICKYVRKWTVYIPIDRRYTPTGLWAWSELVSRAKAPEASV